MLWWRFTDCLKAWAEADINSHLIQQNRVTEKLGDVPSVQPGGCETRVSIQSPDLQLFLLLNDVSLSGCS